MKTTLDLPDDLLIEAKSAAARRRISLKALIEHALRRELSPGRPGASGDNGRIFRLDEDGLPYVPSRKGRVTSESVYRL